MVNAPVIVAGALGSLAVFWFLKNRTQSLNPPRKIIPTRSRQSLVAEATGVSIHQNKTPAEVLRITGRPLTTLNAWGLGDTEKGKIYGLDGKKVFAPWGLNGKPDYTKIQYL